MNNNIIKFITCGSVDDGKSTLIGRILYDINSIFIDQLDTLKQDSKKYGTQKGNIDFALLTDGLLSERDQGITIDVAYKYFDYKDKKYIIADTPGHEQYTRNMATAASNSDIAIILIDATKGVSIQTKRHFFITTLFGVRNIIVAINKIDIVNYSQDIYENIKSDFSKLITSDDTNISFVPISALNGDNVVYRSSKMEWFEGASLLDILQNMECNIQDTNTLRFPIQYINRPDSSFRGYVGTIASGKLNVGDKIKITPSNKITTIKEIITFDNNLQSASKDEAITVTFDDQIDVSRGDIITLADDKSKLSSSFDTTIIWMDDEPYDSSKQYQLKIHTLNTNAKITINSIKDLNSTQDISSARININDIAFCSIELDKEVLLNTFDTNKITGSFILINPYTNKTSATGVITKLHQKNRNIFVQEHTITKELRVKNIEQKPMIIWLTGLSASGKSTIANELEKQLYAKGYKTYLLDGDNLRNGLNSDLGFSQEDRKENIRRVAHVASLMLDAGLIVITAFISPFLEDRAYARSLVKEDEFIEVFIDTPLEVCEKRDTKGLYKKAKDGIIKDFTGISSPYEKPINAELVLNNIDIEKSVQEILYFIESKS